MDAGDRANGFRDGVRFAVTWLHDRAKTMNDPNAKDVLNVAAHELGIEGKNHTLEAKAKKLENALASASTE